MSTKTNTTKPSDRKIKEMQLDGRGLPTGDSWFSTEKHFTVTRDPELGGYNIEDQRGKAWWVPATAVAWIVYEDK
jgi:hypothetical protein